MLREHILDSAKHAFLESGFERTSMDAIATRASTSKRSLYAHFATKDVLFLAVIERSRALFVERIKTPAGYASQPAEAMVRYCGRLAQLLRWSSMTMMLRLSIAESERLPQIALGLHDIVFESTASDLADYAAEHFALTPEEAAAIAQDLAGFAVYPIFPRLLFGAAPLVPAMPKESDLGSDVDLDRIRRHLQLILPAAAPK